MLRIGDAAVNEQPSAAAMQTDARQLHWPWLSVVLLLAACRLIAYVPPQINDFATSHYLFTYAAGFHKRALPGAALSLFFGRLTGPAIYAISLMTLVVFVVALSAFMRSFLLTSRSMLVLGVVLLGAPGVLPHFAYALGYFDPILVMCALLAVAVLAASLPVWLQAPIAFVACAAGVLTHESFLLVGFPLIAAMLLIERVPRVTMLSGLGGAILALTVLVQAVGHPSLGLDQYMLQAASRTDTHINVEAFELLYFQPRENLAYLLQHYSSAATAVRLVAGLIAPLPYLVMLRDLYKTASEARELSPRIRAAVCVCLFAPLILAVVGFDVLRWVSIVCLNCSMLICGQLRLDSSGAVEDALTRYVGSARFMLLALLSFALGALHVVDSNSIGGGLHSIARGLGLIQW